jgi:hypothetical protein
VFYNVLTTPQQHSHKTEKTIYSSETFSSRIFRSAPNSPSTQCHLFDLVGFTSLWHSHRRVHSAGFSKTLFFHILRHLYYNFLNGRHTFMIFRTAISNTYVPFPQLFAKGKSLKSEGKAKIRVYMAYWGAIGPCQPLYQEIYLHISFQSFLYRSLIYFDWILAFICWCNSV